jgi:hypothetical protein
MEEDKEEEVVVKAEERPLTPFEEAVRSGQVIVEEDDGDPD